MVKLCEGFELDGMTNGNIEIPQVKMTPACPKDDNTKARAPLPALLNKPASAKAATPSTGNNHSMGASV